MDLTTYVESIRRDLVAAAEVAGEDARVAADRMTAALDSAVRLALLDALSEASAEITRDLAPGSVEVRLRGRDPEFALTVSEDMPPAEPEVPATGASESPAPPEESGTARLTLRMPENLKTRVEEAAESEGLSVNQWLIRTVNAALSESDGGPARGGGSRSGSSFGPDVGRRRPGRSFGGWVR